MTVGELTEQLSQYDNDKEVLLEWDGNSGCLEKNEECGYRLYRANIEGTADLSEEEGEEEDVVVISAI